MHLSQSQQDLYSRVVAALIGAKADEALADGAGFAHRVADVAMDQVVELRTRVRAERLRKQRRSQ